MVVDESEMSRGRLLAYLLGELTAEDLAAIDARVLCDDAFAEALEALRTDLLDEYALGPLDAAERDRIRRALNLRGEADSPVRFARALHRRLEREATPRHSLWTGWVRWALPIAASVLLVFGAWWYWPDSPLLLSRSAPSGEAAYTVLLRPVRLRAAEALRTVRIPSGVTKVRVQIELRGPATFAAVDLHGPHGRLHFEHLAVRTFDGVRFVQVTVPRSALQTGRYTAVVRSQGGAEAEQRYALWVLAP